MNVLAFTKYSYEGPSSRYRFYNYRKCFEENGIELTMKPLFCKSYFTVEQRWKKAFVVLGAYLKRLFLVLTLLFSPKKFDLVLVEYELFPYLPAWFEYLLHQRGVRYIVDYDDAIFHRYDLGTNPLFQAFLKNKIAKVIAYARYVIVCNAYLEAHAKRHNAHLKRLPTVVLLDRYKQAMQQFERKEANDFVIGWIGSKSSCPYILEILPAMKRFAQKYPDIRFDLVGFDAALLTEAQKKETHLNILPWSETTEIEKILNFDVGIMPLHDDPWSRGKCAFKLIQYMSCKKPVIASSVGMNCELVKTENGFLADSEDAWFEAFETLYLDRKLCRQMGEANFEKVLQGYNHATNCKKYAALLRGLDEEQ